ncbi:hypothetical protein GCM10011340_17100 [Roseivirga thermotolerans]|uniref:Uncharacterized protein n=1 Tax=Roseivirga thermotolerans TaxID=1758176 RepID=A0ABQ3I6I4_9BACT|nr:hypothetical protein GCM10011340_17100 [Roseivirga thermotolerans]
MEVKLSNIDLFLIKSRENEKQNRFTYSDHMKVDRRLEPQALPSERLISSIGESINGRKISTHTPSD